jgi:hypothetical protein
VDKARAWTIVQISQETHPGQARQAAGLMQQVAHGHLGRCLGVRDAEPGQVALNRGIQVDLAGFGELHHRQGCE